MTGAGREINPVILQRVASLKNARFRIVDTYYLFDRDREILCGPAEEVLVFALWLQADPPPDLPALRARVQEMIQCSRGCSFCPGPGLKGGGS